jgi:hypothetical protein
VGNVGWADCIRVLLGRFQSGHAVQSRTHKCCRVYLTAEWGGSGQSRNGQTVKRDNTELLTIQTSRTAAKLQLKAFGWRLPHPAIVIGCCMSQRRSSFMRKGMNFCFFSLSSVEGQVRDEFQDWYCGNVLAGKDDSIRSGDVWLWSTGGIITGKRKLRQAYSEKSQPRCEFTTRPRLTVLLLNSVPAVTCRRLWRIQR